VKLHTLLVVAAVVPLAGGLYAASSVTRVDVRAGESLVSVRDRVRALSPEDRARGVEVVFPAGDYVLDGTLALGPEDGGVTPGKPVVWRAERPGTVHFTSAKVLPVARFRPVTDAEVLKRLPPENGGKTLVADVADLLPPGELPPFELFVNGDFATCARWPNAGTFTSFTGRVDVGTENAARKFERGAFVYSNPRAKRWDFAKGVKFYGYWTHDWSSCSAVAHFHGTENGTNDVIRLSTPVSYGVNRGTWGRKERRFYVYDLLEELDAPREWWLDRDRRKLYLVPENGALKTGDVVRLAPKAPPAVEATGLANFRLEGLSFEDHNGTVLTCAGCRDLTVCDCTFVGIGATPAVGLDGSRCRVLRCELRHLAGAGLHLRGGDRQTLERARNLVEHCRILDFGVRIRTYQGAIEAKGCGHVIRNNEFAYAPHHAMRYETNETIIENNDIHHVLLETGDAGAIYTGRDCTTQGNVVRYNFIHELGSEGADDSTMGLYFDDCDCGDVVYGNVFWKCPRGILLGGGRDHPITGNVFAECRIGLSIDFRGKTWKSFYERKKGHADSYQPDRMAKMHVTEEPWKSRYPRLARQLEDSPMDPLYDPVTSNVFINCVTALVRLDKGATDDVLAKMTFADNLVFVTPGVEKWAKPDKRIEKAFEVKSHASATGFVAPLKGDFRLVPKSAVKARLPSFDLGPRWREE